MAQTAKLDWNEINMDALKGDMGSTFKAYLKAQQEAKAAWDAFVKVAQPKADQMADDGQVAVLTYKRGKLLVAFKDAPASTTASKDAITL